MKKSVKIVIIIVAVLIALCLAFSGILLFAFKDKISDSDKKIIDKTVLLTHNTEKGEKIQVSFSCGTNKIAEDTYLVEVLFNADQLSDNYNTDNVRIVSKMNNKVAVRSAFYSADGPNYTVPSISYADDQQIYCSSEEGYVHLMMLLSGEQMEKLSFDVEYDVIGEGLYSFNKFYQQSWEDLEFVLE